MQARGGGALSFVFTVLSFVAHVGSGIYAIYVNVCVCVLGGTHFSAIFNFTPIHVQIRTRFTVKSVYSTDVFLPFLKPYEARYVCRYRNRLSLSAWMSSTLTWRPSMSRT